MLGHSIPFPDSMRPERQKCLLALSLNFSSNVIRNASLFLLPSSQGQILVDPLLLRAGHTLLYRRGTVRALRGSSTTGIVLGEPGVLESLVCRAEHLGPHLQHLA